MFGEDHVRKIKNIPMSNGTVSWRIKDMSIDIEATINERIKKIPFFSIQVDESTDVSGVSILLVIARYLNVNELEEKLLLCYPLTKRCTGEDIFNAIQNYFCENEIDWSNCCGVCTDGGKSMSGCYKGLRGRIKIVAPHVTWDHCCIHRQSLAAKPLPDSLKEVLNQSVKVVHFIKANSTNSQLFKSLRGDMGSLHTTLLLHTEVRCLSRGNVLTRLFELRHEVLMFFEDHPFTLSSKFYESEWLQQLAYLSDIFSEINKLNLGLQNHSITIFKATDKIESMINPMCPIPPDSTQSRFRRFWASG
ncbi:Zinc finger BED domain-containing protein 5 [Araneus ventricosus]|uniref:Zinc finger BED domain-containing protein 5 n=1 Tax=Araneus ventricosus TaxID=182803 RepID=A0A4Y2CZF3_ARAVE|nr:Zinc finger BED domain-containing protein 5 [Araneus ventricosus]